MALIVHLRDELESHNFFRQELFSSLEYGLEGADNDSCVNQDTGQIHWLHFPANLNVMDGAANIRVDTAEAVMY